MRSFFKAANWILWLFLSLISISTAKWLFFFGGGGCFIFHFTEKTFWRFTQKWRGLKRWREKIYNEKYFEVFSHIKFFSPNNDLAKHIKVSRVFTSMIRGWLKNVPSETRSTFSTFLGHGKTVNIEIKPGRKY